MFLKERGILKYKLQSGRIEDARQYLKENFPKLFEQSTKIRSLLDALQFIKYIQEPMSQSENSENGQANASIIRALNFSQTDLSQYLVHPQLVFPTMDQNGIQRLVHVSQVTTLICFTQEALLSGRNDFSFMLTEQQRLIIADIVNNEILRFENGIKEDGCGGLQNTNTFAANQSTKKESLTDGGNDERVPPSEGVSVGNKQLDSANDSLGYGSVYSNMEMVMK